MGERSTRIDMAGRVVGRLTVVRYVDTVRKAPRWLCRCECGGETVAFGGNLRRAHTTSCGCLHRERSSEAARRPRPANDFRDRFWAKVEKNGPIPEYRPDLGPCWIWTAALKPSGYGQFMIGGRCCYAHRVAYETTVGIIPAGLELDHLCREPRCCNPAHLEPVTGAENHRRSTGPAKLAEVYRAKRARTCCRYGHAYRSATAVDKNGRRYRVCSECANATQRRLTARRREQRRLLVDQEAPQASQTS